MMIIRIPEREIEVAKSLGLRVTDIQSSWTRYVEWSIKTFGETRAELGGESWAKWARDDAAKLATRYDAQAEAKDRKAREDAAYRREAVRGSLDAIWKAGEQSAKQGGCTCARCRTVLVVDDNRAVLRPREISPADLLARRRARRPVGHEPRADIVVEQPIDDVIMAERREQALRDLAQSDLLIGLRIDPT
jgi:hypothetical protein